MSERKGVVINYNPINRQGKIRPEDNGPAALFYITSVTNPEPEPKANDIVIFNAPEPRKNKTGKIVQENASSVTVEERAPEPPPEKKKPRKNPKKKRRAKGDRERKGKNKDRERTKNKKFTNKRRKPPRRTKIRYPLPSDIPSNIIHMKESNPSLVLDKYLQWPTPKQKKNNKPSEESTPQGNTTADSTNTDSWNLLPRHRDFFLSKTVAGLYRNFERNSLPWNAVRIRKEAMLGSLEKNGYSVASAIVKGPWGIAFRACPDHLLNEASFSLHYNFGYPYIPASGIVDLFQRATKSEIEPSLIVFDAEPVTRIGQVTIEKSNCYYPVWDESDKITSDSSIDRESYAILTGEDAAFSFSIAEKGLSGGRKKLVEILSELTSSIKEVNEKFVASTEDSNLKNSGIPGAILW